jgi:broad specificity phosphatase PhoE
MLKMLDDESISRVVAIYCSTEQKAMDGAAIISEVLGIPYTTIPEFGENDCSATGYLSEPEFDTVVDEFFRRPEESVRGWERAVDAQRRTIAGTKAVLRAKPVNGNVAIVALMAAQERCFCAILRAYRSAESGINHVQMG